MEPVRLNATVFANLKSQTSDQTIPPLGSQREPESRRVTLSLSGRRDSVMNRYPPIQTSIGEQATGFTGRWVNGY